MKKYTTLVKHFAVWTTVTVIIFVCVSLALTVKEKQETTLGHAEQKPVIFAAADSGEISLYTDRKLFSLRVKPLKTAFESIYFAIPGVICPLIFFLQTVLG